jgi:arylsulfatase A-like enzyme
LGRSAGSAAERPNIVLIMSDDMGFSDLGCYGGEIATPHLDSLAAQGVRFMQFYNGARCCPTRAQLLTGLYAHQAGIGFMEPTNSYNKPFKQATRRSASSSTGRTKEASLRLSSPAGPTGFRRARSTESKSAT